MTTRRVLFFSHSPELFGAPRSLFLLLEALRDDAELDVTAACFGAGAFPRKVVDRGIRCHVLHSLPRQQVDAPSRVQGALNLLIGVLQCVWLILRCRTDVVYVNSIARIEPILAGWLLRRKVVVHVRESRNYFYGPGLVRKLRAYALKGCANRIITVSGAIRELVVSLGVPREKTLVIYNGIAVKGLSEVDSERRTVRSRLDVSDDTTLITFVGNLIERKGIEFFLDVAHRVSSQCDRCSFLIVGGDLNSDYATDVVRPLAQRLNLGSALTFTGQVENPSAYLAASDVFLMTSRAEPFARVNLEAMEAALPIVATSVDGNAEAIVHGETGYLVPYGDAESFAARVLGLLRDADERRRLGRKGRSRVVEHFPLEKYVDRCRSVILDART